MKKKICLLLLSLCVAVSSAACGGSKGDSSSAGKETEASGETDSGEKSDSAEKTKDLASRIVNISKEELAKCVKLGDYKGLSVDESVQEVTDGDVDQQIQSELAANPVETTDENAAVKEGDTVNINYVGKKDGVAFDGGTADNYDLTIGSGTFIDGFEDGLIGCKKGDTVDLNLTFPEQYQSEELAGQDVVFTVTVNAIKTTPELTEDWVLQNTDYDSIDAYREGVLNDLKTSNEQDAKSSAMNDLWQQVMDNTEVKSFPEEAVSDMVDQYMEAMKSYAEQAGTDVDDLLSSQGVDEDQLKEYAKESLKQSMVVQAIMDAEGMTLDDEGQKAAEAEYAESYGIDDISQISEEVGEDNLNQSISMMRVWDFIMDNAKVNKVISTEDGKQGYDADAAE